MVPVVIIENMRLAFLEDKENEINWQYTTWVSSMKNIPVKLFLYYINKVKFVQ